MSSLFPFRKVDQAFILISERGTLSGHVIAGEILWGNDHNAGPIHHLTRPRIISHLLNAIETLGILSVGGARQDQHYHDCRNSRQFHRFLAFRLKDDRPGGVKARRNALRA